MLEMLLSPRKAKRRPWEMFFVGFVYASVAIFLVYWIFSQDAVLSKYSGILVVTFTVMFSLPFMYFSIKDEEEVDVREEGMFRMLKEHSKAVYGLMWLFIGFIIAFSFWNIVLGSNQNFQAQIETYCAVNRPANFNECIAQYGAQKTAKTTAFSTSSDKLFAIFANNIYVLIFTIVFSLVFGAGAIFVLAWNASVIAAAVGIFTKSNLSSLPLGIARYMIHGVFEIGAYFIVALAGGILSVAVIKREMAKDKFWNILQDALNLIILAVIILFIAALIEVFITPALF